MQMELFYPSISKKPNPNYELERISKKPNPSYELERNVWFVARVCFFFFWTE